MMQMQPHLQHHGQPPMHPGQNQPSPHHMQMSAMAVQQQQQQQQQQQMMSQQQQMGLSPQQQQQQQQQQMQQNHLTNANLNGMMNMGMTPPQSHYMNQQMHNQQQGQLPGHPMQQQQQQPTHPGGHMSPHQVAPPMSGSPPQQNAASQQCIRHGCQNKAIVNPDWEDEYCSNECVITHCRDVFGNWVQSNNSQQQSYSAVK